MFINIDSKKLFQISEFAMIRQTAIALRGILTLFFIGMLITGASAQGREPSGQLAAGPTAQEHLNPKPMIATASIPFEFWIGPERMPSGHYVLEIIVPSVAILRTEDGKAQQELFTQDTGGPVVQKESRLIFVLRNEKPMLSEIWCVEGKRRLTSETAPSSGDHVQTRVVSLSYP